MEGSDIKDKNEEWSEKSGDESEKCEKTNTNQCEVKVKGGIEQNGFHVFEMWGDIGGNEIKWNWLKSDVLISCFLNFLDSFGKLFKNLGNDELEVSYWKLTLFYHIKTLI
jgi:hypothetical protein